MPKQPPTTRTATFEARHMTFIPQAITGIQGDRPIMLSYKFGRILGALRDLQAALRESLVPYVNEAGDGLRKDITKEEQEAVDKIMTEELSIEVPTVSLEELQEAGLTVDDDSILLYLVEDVGLLVP